MTGSQGIPASTKACCGRSLRELFGENTGERHHIQYCVVSDLAALGQRTESLDFEFADVGSCIQKQGWFYSIRVESFARTSSMINSGSLSTNLALRACRSRTRG
jgi:hypothetical protein